MRGHNDLNHIPVIKGHKAFIESISKNSAKY